MTNNTSGITWKTRSFHGLEGNDNITFRSQSTARLKIGRVSERTIGKHVLKVYNAIRDLIGDGAEIAIDVIMSDGKFYSAEVYIQYKGNNNMATITPNQHIELIVSYDTNGVPIGWAFTK